MVTAERAWGFTLIELLVVMAIVATLLSMVAPRYFKHVDRSKEIVLRQNLLQVRDAIDKFYADTNKYPDTLDELVEKRYIRSMPLDPITDSTDTWTFVPPKNGEPGSVYDLKSGASGTASDGTNFTDW